MHASGGASMLACRQSIGVIALAPPGSSPCLALPIWLYVKRFLLAGRPCTEWVCELDQRWHTARASHPHRLLTVDLTSVTYIDQARRYLLRLIHHDNVRFVTSSLMWHDLIDHITGATE